MNTALDFLSGFNIYANKFKLLTDALELIKLQMQLLCSTVHDNDDQIPRVNSI